VTRFASLAAVLAALAAPAPALAQAEPEPVTIAVIDSGIDAGHQEFGPGQITAWWDFTNEDDVPDEGPDAWDERKAPYDGNGHGTQVAGIAAGRNLDARKSMSLAPGRRLAVAKVGTAGGSITGDLAAAFRWAVDVAGADVINMSIGSIVPLPGAPLLLSSDVYEAIAYARSQGALVTVANGNGTGNAGLVPGDGASSTFASSLDVLAVGASGLDGLTVSYQPEVSAAYSVVGPEDDGEQGPNDGYGPISGTSFSSPYTAGFAARLIEAARAAGADASPERIEQLVKFSARDTELPPVTEGYGIIDAAQLEAALAHAAAGTLPGRPSPDLNAIYVEEVAGAERKLNNGELPG
jgi:subtilisin family serine protease